MSRAPVLLVSHGAASLSTRPGDPLHEALRRTAPALGGIRALVVISAHDVREQVTVGVAPTITMVEDHPAAQGLSWSAPGAPDVGAEAIRALAAAGILAVAGEPLLDHGAWVPLRALDPSGRWPLVTVSLHGSLDSALHVRLGAALASLRDDGVAVLASGGLTHNQHEFRRGYFAREAVDTVAPPGLRFETWALAALETAGPTRTRTLLDAPRHPDFVWCHPTMDHWLPAVVAAGAAEEQAGHVLHRGHQHSLSTAMVGFGLPHGAPRS